MAAAKTDHVWFDGAHDTKLAGRFDFPSDAEPRAYALFAHCFTCSKDFKAIHRISRGLASAGVAVLRFDFTGLGESEGDFADTNFSSNLEDLQAAVAYLRSAHRAPDLLVGHSLGGAAVLASAADVPECHAVATIGAPSETRHLRDTLLQANPDLETEETVEIQLAGRPFRVRQQLLEDLGDHRLKPAIGGLNRPLMVMHAPRDETVDIDHARRIFEAAKHPKSFVALDGADHLMRNDPKHAEFVAGILSAWIARYV